MSDDARNTPVPNISQTAVSGIDAEPLTPARVERSHLAGHPENRPSEPENTGEEVLRGDALDEAVRAANEDGAGIKSSLTADEKRAALAEYEASR